MFCSSQVPAPKRHIGGASPKCFFMIHRGRQGSPVVVNHAFVLLTSCFERAVGRKLLSWDDTLAGSS